MEYGHIQTASARPGGFKGMGEGGAIGAPAAVFNAVADALAPLGVVLTDQPLTPRRHRAGHRGRREPADSLGRAGQPRPLHWRGDSSVSPGITHARTPRSPERQLSSSPLVPAGGGPTEEQTGRPAFAGRAAA